MRKVTVRKVDEDDEVVDVEVDFVSFVDCPDCSDLIGSDSTEKLFMGIS